MHAVDNVSQFCLVSPHSKCSSACKWRAHHPANSSCDICAQSKSHSGMINRIQRFGTAVASLLFQIVYIFVSCYFPKSSINVFFCIPFFFRAILRCGTRFDLWIGPICVRKSARACVHFFFMILRAKPHLWYKTSASARTFARKRPHARVFGLSVWQLWTWRKKQIRI